jgi:hypothetical protein
VISGTSCPELPQGFANRDGDVNIGLGLPKANESPVIGFPSEA